MCCIFPPVFGCCALQILVEIVIFSAFCAKKPKKQEIWRKVLQKTRFLKFAPERWSTVLFIGNKAGLIISSEGFFLGTF